MGSIERRFRRIASSFSAKCRLLSDLERYHPVSVVNINHAGCCLNGESSFDAGQKLMVVIELPLGDSLYLRSEVRWAKAYKIYKGGLMHEGFHIGLSFLLDDPVTLESSEQIFKYCELH